MALSVTSVDGYDSFITFTDDYSCYGHIYPIQKRSDALEIFKIYKTEVEKQHNTSIKIVKSDWGVNIMGNTLNMVRLKDHSLSIYKKMA